MSKTLVDNQKDYKSNFNEYIEKELFKEFKCYIGEYGEETAKKNIIDNQDSIIDNLISKIEDLKAKNNEIYLSFKYYYLYEDIEDIIYSINKTFIKIYKETFKTYDFKVKMEKENTKTLIYNEMIKDIENRNNDISLQFAIQILKTNDYKQEFLKELKEKYAINEKLFNDYYLSIRNKVIREYKDQAEIEQAQQVQQNKIKIPFIWKLYGITKITEKINKKIWK